MTLVCLLVLLVVAVPATGCSSDPSGPVTTAPPGTTTSATGDSTTTTAPVELSDWDRELAKTAQAGNKLSILLDEEKAPADDPRTAVVYGLHARAQAIGCRQMLEKGDAASLETSDGVMLDIYHMLNLARDRATGTAAETLAASRAIADKIGAPSKHVDEAKGLLDQFIEATAPLVDEATALISPSTP